MEFGIRVVAELLSIGDSVESAPQDPEHPHEWSPAEWHDYDDSNTFTRTNRGAINGDIEQIKRGLKFGERLNTHTFMYAAQEGRLEVLKYLLEQKCPLDIWAFMMAIQQNHFECLKFLCEECLTPENVDNINRPCWSDMWITGINGKYHFTQHAKSNLLRYINVYGSSYTDISGQNIRRYMESMTAIDDCKRIYFFII